jgi:hypothetical protein
MTRAFDLTTAERAELTCLRDTAPQAYRRERAAALVKVADGMTAAQVARHDLLRPRKPDTVDTWMDRFIEGSLAGAYPSRRAGGLGKAGTAPAAPAPAIVAHPAACQSGPALGLVAVADPVDTIADLHLMVQSD